MKKCYVIAEIGQNHQGNMQLAKRMIQIAKVRTSNKFFRTRYRKHMISLTKNRSKQSIYNSEKLGIEEYEIFNKLTATK